MKNAKSSRSAISPTREENYADWYLEVVKKAELAEHTQVRGCMVIKPWGYAIWENIRRVLDKKFTQTGHENAYFPLFIPLRYFEKEAKHVEGFAKECAVVTHHRLEQNGEGRLVPGGKLEEPLIVRPTSEMIIGETYAKWVKSYRDLPILINQWANVVRWEMRPRMFLRTAEFLWQEGHTAHETEKEAIAETLQMLNLYVDFCKNYLAMPTLYGRKPLEERFPGAVETYTLEAMMQDRRALQAGTSHFLGQNFAKSCGIQFQTRQSSGEGRSYAWTTSWGVTTRLIGAMIMTHSDDNGLVLPPKIAPKHVVILPIVRRSEEAKEMFTYAEKLQSALQQKQCFGQSISVQIDRRDIRGGEKMWSWVKKGIPLRLEVGPKECASKTVSLSRRIDPVSTKIILPREEVISKTPYMLAEMQALLLENAERFQEEHTQKVETLEELYAFFTPPNDAATCPTGGFALGYYDEQASTQVLQKELGVTVRCIPFDQEGSSGPCLLSGKQTNQRAVFAKAY
ncbi:MAG: proline--tRNA ligase [Chlamydiota bacterium]